MFSMSFNGLKITRLKNVRRVGFVFILLTLFGCDGYKSNSSLAVFVVDEVNKRVCGEQVLANSKVWDIDKLAWYLSDFQIKQSGEWRSVELEVNDFQSENVVLMRVFTPDCQGEQLNSVITFAEFIQWSEVSATRFKLGVPFELNHQNPLVQPSPLNLPDMFWSWQTGHKFLRLDMSSEQDNWSFHLGSVGCDSVTRVRSPASPCVQPNLFTIELTSPPTDGLQLNLPILFDQAISASGGGCMFHGMAESACQPLLNNLQQPGVITWR